MTVTQLDVTNHDDYSDIYYINVALNSVTKFEQSVRIPFSK